MKNYIYREIADDGMLIPVGAKVTEYNGLFMLTATGNIVYKGLTAGKTKDEIVSTVLDRFEIDKETVERDVNMFIEKLTEMEAV